MSPYGGMLVEQSKSFRETMVPNVTWMLVDRAMVLSYFQHLQQSHGSLIFPVSATEPWFFHISGICDSGSLQESRIAAPE